MPGLVHWGSYCLACPQNSCEEKATTINKFAKDASLFMVTSHGKDSPQGHKYLLFKIVKICFSFMNHNIYVSTVHANVWIVCCVTNDWRIIEMVPIMCTCPISSWQKRWHIFWTPPNQDKEQQSYLMYLFNPLFIDWYLLILNASFCY